MFRFKFYFVYVFWWFKGSDIIKPVNPANIYIYIFIYTSNEYVISVSKFAVACVDAARSWSWVRASLLELGVGVYILLLRARHCASRLNRLATVSAMCSQMQLRAITVARNIVHHTSSVFMCWLRRAHTHTNTDSAKQYVILA